MKWRFVVATGVISGIMFSLLLGLDLVLIEHRSLGESVPKAVLEGVFFGVFFGVLFGMLFPRFAGAFEKWGWAKRSATPIFAAEERVIRESPANHFRRFEGVGGWLFLTDHRLVFKSHSLNIQRHEISLPFDMIVHAQPGMTAWVFPNGLLVTTRDGRRERFVVEGRDEWAASIRSAVGKRAQDGSDAV
jgi:hypothetical protein